MRRVVWQKRRIQVTAASVTIGSGNLINKHQCACEMWEEEDFQGA